jgi:hypothetical protein
MRNIAAYVRPGGLFVTSALRRSAGYRVGERWFPSADIDERDLRVVLAAEFERAPSRPASSPSTSPRATAGFCSRRRGAPQPRAGAAAAPART